MRFHYKKLAAMLMFLVQIIFFCAHSAHGDGCFFPPHDYAGEDLREPAQRAVMVYTENQQSLFLFVDYEGDARSFAWVVPCPTKPTMKISSPEVWKEVAQYYDHLRHIAWENERKGGGFGAGAAMPTQMQEDVAVHSIEHVGPYEVAILSANTGQGLERWLEQNKYQMPPRARPILEQYVAEQWFFVAMKVATPSQKLQSLPPIRLDFVTPSPRYPLRISAINSGVTDVRLYVVRSLQEETLKSTQGYFSQAFPMRADVSQLCPTLQDEFPNLDWQTMELRRLQDDLVPQVMKRLDDRVYGGFETDFAPFYETSGNLAYTQGIVEALTSPNLEERHWAEQRLEYYYDALMPQSFYHKPAPEHAAALREMGAIGGEALKNRIIEYILTSDAPAQESSLRGASRLLAWTGDTNAPEIARVTKFLESKSMTDALYALGSPDSRRALNRIAQNEPNLGAAFRLIYSLESNDVNAQEKPIATRELLQLLSKGITKGDATTRGKALLRQYTGQDFEEDWAKWGRWIERNEQ